MTRRDEELPEEKPQKRFGLFGRGKEKQETDEAAAEQPQEMPTGEVVLGGDAQPEQEADPFPRETAFDTQPQPRGAVWQQEDGKLKFSGYVTFWLALCAIYLGNILLSFAVTLLVYRFRDFYFEILGQFEELAYMEEYLRQLLSIIEAEPIRLIVVGVLVAVQFGCVVWFLASKRKLAFYILTVAAVLLSVLQLILGGGLTALIYLLGPFTAWLLLRGSWRLLR